MKKIAIFTTFFECVSGYSLVAVAENQIRMLVDNGYDPIVLVREDFKESGIWNKNQIDLRCTIPILNEKLEWRDTYSVLKENLKKVDALITHDIIANPSYHQHFRALKNYCQENTRLLCLNWIHSRPTSRKRKPPGYVIYPNDIDKGNVAKIYGLDGTRVISSRASHSIDPLLIWNYNGLTKNIVGKFNLLEGDISCIYPVRLDRGKQVKKIIRLLAGIQKLGYDVRFLVVSWQSSGKRFQKYIDELIELATELGIEDKIAFTNRMFDSCAQGVPRHVVTELLDLSNCYIHASGVETYSLVVHEAILRGKFVVLNHDWPPMRELFGNNVMYFDFSSDVIPREYEPDEQTFWNDEARSFMAQFRQNKALMAQTKARKEWTPQGMWKDFEPLFYLEP